MNNVRLDSQLVAATPRHANSPSAFTVKTMQRIHMTQAIRPPRPWWQRFLQIHKLAFGILAAILAGIIGLTSYAYASGTNPISLITRIITGDTVQTTYQGHTYNYGKNRSYSDAAITAYNELNIVRGLAFRANNAFGVPQDGIEYVSDVHPGDYLYPSLATVTSIGNGTAHITQQYLLGDKMNPSHDLTDTLTVSTSDIQYYANGNPAQITQATTPQLVALFPQKYLRHHLADNSIEHVTIYFAFALNHPLADLKEAEQPTGSHLSDPANQPIFEPNWGGESNLCVNNPADTCDNDKIGRDNGQGLYASLASDGPHGGTFNPSALEPAGGDMSDTTILRQNIQGKIAEITPDGFSIVTSSKQTWRISYPVSQQRTFAAVYSPLKIGDTIALGAEQSIYDLNNRALGVERVMFMMRLP